MVCVAFQRTLVVCAVAGYPAVIFKACELLIELNVVESCCELFVCFVTGKLTAYPAVYLYLYVLRRFLAFIYVAVVSVKSA